MHSDRALEVLREYADTIKDDKDRAMLLGAAAWVEALRNVLNSLMPYAEREIERMGDVDSHQEALEALARAHKHV